MKIDRHEIQIIGKWVISSGEIIADEQSERIQWLVASFLKKIAVGRTGWEALFQDPDDNRYWELTYLNGELHGGGPPSLIWISDADTKEKYLI